MNLKLILPSGLTENLEGFHRGYDPPQGSHIHRLHLGDTVEAEVFQPVP